MGENRIGMDRMTIRDVAIALVDAHKIMIEALAESKAVDRTSVQALLRAKSQELLAVRFEEGAGQLLLLMGGIRPGKGPAAE